ncbi:Zinc finger BED domain-containing protein RICESLEEPER 2 [Linum perenne]
MWNNNHMRKKPRIKTSGVWKDFKELPPGEGQPRKLQCIHCKKEYKHESSGPTSHLARHLTKCPRKIANLARVNQQQLNVVVHQNQQLESVNAVETFKYNQTKMREVVCHWIILEEHPLCTADSDMFTYMMKHANTLYQRISRASVTTNLFSTYEIFKRKLHTTLANVRRVSLTTDMWQSNQTIGYMVVTCHFVDENWRLQKRLLDFCAVPPPHSGLVISDALHKCLVNWDLEKKVWTITVDNATANDVAMRTLKGTLTYLDRLSLDGDLFHVRCCAHIMNILVQCGLKEIEGIIENVRRSVKYISSSESRVNIFRGLAQQLQLPTKKLILDCCTRWNSTYHMLAAALELKGVFPRYAERDSTYTWLPSDEDWVKVSHVCQFLEVFSYVTTSISGSSYPTTNIFLPELWSIKRLLKQTLESSITSMRTMAMKMIEKFDKYWGQCNLVVSFAAVLDPTNKFTIIDVMYPDLYDSGESSYYIGLVREKLTKLYDEYATEFRAKNNETPTEQVRETTSATSTANVQFKVLRGKAAFDSIVQKQVSASAGKSELEKYLESDIFEAPTGSEFDVIGWWKEHSQQYKILSRMAIDILAIPITSVASEAAFSAGGRVIDSHRASLGEQTVQALLCTQDWLRNHYGPRKGTKVDVLGGVWVSKRMVQMKVCRFGDADVVYFEMLLCYSHV